MIRTYADLFTGIGGFTQAIHQAHPQAVCSYWSEIDKFSIQTFTKNFPHLKNRNLGSIETMIFNDDFEVNKFRVSLLPDADLVMGGSPCNDLSIQTAKRSGLEGSKSRLFYAFAAIVEIKKPKFFLLENVASMPRDARDKISEILKVEPVEICSSMFTAQKRRRLYWFNWDLDRSRFWDRGVRWKNLVAWSKSTRYPEGAESYVEERETRNGLANTLTTGTGCGSFSSKTFIEENGEKRSLTVNECEMLQGFPKDWTAGVSDSQRFKQLGNAITVPVVKEILSCIS